MSTTKIVLNRQSDLILDNAQITAPVGIVVADIDGLESAITSIDTNVSDAMSTEVSNRVAGDASVAADLSTEASKLYSAIDGEAEDRVAGDESLAANLSTEVANREADVDAELGLIAEEDSAMLLNDCPADSLANKQERASKSILRQISPEKIQRSY